MVFQMSFSISWPSTYYLIYPALKPPSPLYPFILIFPLCLYNTIICFILLGKASGLHPHSHFQSYTRHLTTMAVQIERTYIGKWE